MSDTRKTDKQESSGFFMNPMNLYGVGGIPFPVFTPQFGPMVPMRMMAPMWAMNTSFMQPYTENVNGASSKPPSDTPDNTPYNDQPGGNAMPFMWPMNAPFMQEYMKNMNASMTKSSPDISILSDSLKSSARTMVAPMWPMNAAFMQQCMEGFGGPMSNPMTVGRAAAKQSTSNVSAKKESVISATAESSVVQVPGPSDTVDQRVDAGADNTGEADGVSADKPKTASANHSGKIAEMTFPDGSPFMPFSNIAGFIPYTTYIPYFKPVDMNQGSSSKNEQQQMGPSKAQAETECSSLAQVIEEDKSSSVPVKEKQEPVVTSLKDESSDNDVHQQGETPLPEDSGCSEASDTGNSAEMDVAQILVNFMPVPVIGNAGQEDVDERNQQEDAKILVMEEGTVPLAGPEIELNTTLDEPGLSSEALSYCTADNVNTEGHQEGFDSSKAQISQARLSIQDHAEVTPKVDSMEVSVIKSSKDVVMEVKESGTGHNTSVLGGKVLKPVEMEQKEPIPEGCTSQVALEKQVMQHVFEEQVTQGVSKGQVSPQALKGQAVPQASKGQVVPCVSEMQVTQHVCEEQVVQHVFKGQVTPGVSNGHVTPQVSEGQGVSNMPVTPVLEVKQEYDSTDQYQVNGSPSDTVDTNGEIPRIAKVTYKCEVCSQLFRSSLGLQKHLEFHTDDGQHYTCTICFERFQDSSTLQEHIAYHMRKRPHKCQFCPKAFRDPGSLQKHVRVHTGEKPYKCTNCFRSFAEYSSLRKHLRVHTGEQPYKCQYCSKAFSISGNLQRHVLIHTGERPYKCSFCPKAFNNPSHLRRHVKNLHFKGEGGSGADVMIAMAAAVAAAEGKVALGNGEMAEGVTLTANNAGSSSENFTNIIVPYKKDRDQDTILGDQSMMIKMDLSAAISQPVNIK